MRQFLLVGIFTFIFSVAGFSAPCIYISNYTGHQILCVNSESGATSIVYTGASNFWPEDMVVGPDGKLYIADSLQSKLWRLDTTTQQLESVPAATFAYPQGPSFSGSDDLYATSKAPGAGVWKLQNAANPPATASKIIDASTSGGGTAFTAAGNLLYVDTAAGKVYSADLPDNSSEQVTTKQLISNLNAPVGIAVNTCGDVLVATGNSIKRFDPITGAAKGTYATFGRNDLAKYIEVGIDNVLYAVTATDDAGDGGKIWKITPADPSNPITSCSSGNTNGGPLVALASLLRGKDTLPGLSSDQALGLAIPAGSVTIKHSFGAGAGDACKGTAFNATDVEKTYNFGHHSVVFRFTQILKCFELSVTAIQSRPRFDIAFGGEIPPATQAVRYASMGGFATEIVVNDPPAAGEDYVSTNTGKAYSIKLNYYHPQHDFAMPGVGHSPSASPDYPKYTDDITHDFWPSANPGDDPGDLGTADGFSRFIAFNAPLALNGAFFTLKEPTAEPQTPQFKQGQTIRVAFNLTDANGRPITDLIARLSIAKNEPFETQEVVSRNGEVDNIFKSGSGNLWVYSVDSSNLTPGLLTFTIFSNGYPPYSFPVLVVGK